MSSLSPISILCLLLQGDGRERNIIHLTLFRLCVADPYPSSHSCVVISRNEARGQIRLKFLFPLVQISILPGVRFLVLMPFARYVTEIERYCHSSSFFSYERQRGMLEMSQTQFEAIKRRIRGRSSCNPFGMSPAL